jgi:hypothetical protein
MMRSPGDSRIESAAACACFLEPIGEDRTYLRGGQSMQGLAVLTNIQMKSIDQDQFGQEDRRSLVVDGLPTVMVQVADL